ncbi:hypothetical protein B0H16DRAFT_1460413 [Mycena metata]|uniref:Uncharacterized protein n=1 Tax=Mycena metata TaxID=1033252 RepID=A0AAD7IVA6_9AGAR|nr:hypothetical protein B0H16DRAFT_1460413 [Mycena metata]
MSFLCPFHAFVTVPISQRAKPAQRHLIAQLANICARSVHQHRRPPHELLPHRRRFHRGSPRELGAGGIAPPSLPLWANAQRLRRRNDRRRRVRATGTPSRGRARVRTEDVVFPPVPSFRASQHTDNEQVEMDIEGEDGRHVVTHPTLRRRLLPRARRRIRGASSRFAVFLLPAPHAAGATSPSSSSTTSAVDDQAHPGGCPTTESRSAGSAVGSADRCAARGEGGGDLRTWAGTSFASGSRADEGRRVVGAFAPEGMGMRAKADADEGGEDVGGDGYGAGRSTNATGTDYAMLERAGGWDFVTDVSYTTSSSSTSPGRAHRRVICGIGWMWMWMWTLLVMRSSVVRVMTEEELGWEGKRTMDDSLPSFSSVVIHDRIMQ